MRPSHLIAFFSPAGTTRRVAETIQQRLIGHGLEATVIDLSSRPPLALETGFAALHQPCCLWIGSPVYCDHAVPLVLDWIEALPAGFHGYAVPFVTWGGVTSGLALPEMTRCLRRKKFAPLAAAKVLAEHSSMWRVPEPLASGHPDQEDLAQVRALVDTVIDKLKQKEIVPLDPARLEYLSPSLRAEASSKSLALAKAAMPPLVADEQRCTRCGLCAAVCPVAALTLDPFPVIGASCVLCMQCVRACADDAFSHNAEAGAARIRDMAARSDEHKATAVFV